MELKNVSYQDFRNSMRNSLAFGSAAHLFLISFLKMISLDGCGLIFPGRWLWEVHPKMISVPFLAAGVLIAVYAILCFAGATEVDGIDGKESFYRTKQKHVIRNSKSNPCLHRKKTLWKLGIGFQDHYTSIHDIIRLSSSAKINIINWIFGFQLWLSNLLTILFRRVPEAQSIGFFNTWNKNNAHFGVVRHISWENIAARPDLYSEI